MVFKVAELVATLRLDKNGYDTGLMESRSEMANLGTQAQSTGSSIGGALANGMRTASAIAVGLGIASGVTLKKVLDTGIAYNGLQQTSRAALRTLLGGAEAANAQMDKLDAFAKTSPFSKSVFISAQQQLIGFGASADKVIPMLSAINDAVAAIGGSNDDIASISGSLARVIGTGKLTGDTLNELGNRGINAAQILADGFGVSVATIQKQIEKGTLDSGKALDILVAGMGTKFAGAAANVKETIEGARDRVKAATRDIGAALAEPFVGKNGGGRLVQWANDWADVLRAVEKRVPPVVSLFQDRFSPQLALVSTLLQNLKGAVKGFDLSGLETGFDKLAQNLPAVGALSGAVLALSGQFLSGIPIVGGFLGSLNPLTLAIMGAVAASPQLRAALGDLIGALAPLLPAVGQLAGALSGMLTSALASAAPLVGGLGDVLGAVAQAIAPLLIGISGLASGFSDLPGTVQTVLVALGLLLLAKPQLTTMFSAVGTAAQDMGKKIAGASVGGALKGLLGIFGGPWGLALGAAVTGLSLFAAENQKTKDRVQEFTDALDQNTGAVTANTSTVAGKKLQEYSDTFKSLRLNVKDAADAVANGGQPFVDMQNKLEGLRKATALYQQTQGMGGTVHAEAKQQLIELARQYGINADDATNLSSGAIMNLMKTMSGLRGEVVSTSDKWIELNRGTKEAEPVHLRLSDAIKKVGDASGNTSERLQAYQDIIDAMNGKTKTAEQSNRDLAKTGRDLTGFFSEVNDAGQRFNAGLALNADGTVKLNDAGDRLQGMLDGLATKGQAAAIQAIDLANAQGRQTSAAADADKALAPFRQSLQDLADKGLISQGQVDALSKSLFGVPGETAAVLTDKDSAPAVKLKVDELTRTILATPNKEITITEPLSPAIVGKLQALGYTVNTLPNGQVQIFENGAAAARSAVESVRESVRLTNGSKAWVYVVADTTQAMSDIERLRANSQIQANLYATGGAYRAAGAVVDYYAAGGLREHPRLTPMSGALADIVPANSWRVIGDNMRSPELFAPLDGSARSIALMEEGARRMGFDMVPRSAARYLADGGILGGTPSAPAGSVAPSFNVHVTVQNPFTGAEVTAVVKSVAVKAADDALTSFTDDLANRRIGV